jgi:hypothetical protein
MPDDRSGIFIVLGRKVGRSVWHMSPLEKIGSGKRKSTVFSFLV